MQMSVVPWKKTKNRWGLQQKASQFRGADPFSISILVSFSFRLPLCADMLLSFILFISFFALCSLHVTNYYYVSAIFGWSKRFPGPVNHKKSGFCPWPFSGLSFLHLSNELLIERPKGKTRMVRGSKWYGFILFLEWLMLSSGILR